MANSAFDIIRECHKIDLQTTMVTRSPSYIFPYVYVINAHGIGTYNIMTLEAADRLLNALPSGLDGQSRMN
jgi:cation diffusion facilitator CzcD-associated flavoprotein CzcO